MYFLEFNIFLVKIVFTFSIILSFIIILGRNKKILPNMIYFMFFFCFIPNPSQMEKFQIDSGSISLLGKGPLSDSSGILQTIGSNDKCHLHLISIENKTSVDFGSGIPINLEALSTTNLPLDSVSKQEIVKPFVTLIEPNIESNRVELLLDGSLDSISSTTYKIVDTIPACELSSLSKMYSQSFLIKTNDFLFQNFETYSLIQKKILPLKLEKIKPFSQVLKDKFFLLICNICPEVIFVSSASGIIFLIMVYYGQGSSQATVFKLLERLITSCSNNGSNSTTQVSAGVQQETNSSFEAWLSPSRFGSGNGEGGNGSGGDDQNPNTNYNSNANESSRIRPFDEAFLDFLIRSLISFVTNPVALERNTLEDTIELLRYSLFRANDLLQNEDYINVFHRLLRDRGVPLEHWTGFVTTFNHLHGDPQQRLEEQEPGPLTMVDVLNAPFNDGEEGQQQPTAVNVNSRTIAVDMQVIDALNVQYTPVEDALFMYETYLQAQPIAEETGTMVVLAENEIGYTGIEFLPQPEQTFQNNIRTFEVLVDSIKEFNSGNMPDPSLTYQDNLGMLLFGVQDLRNLIQNPEYMEEFETILMAYDLDMTAFESIVSQLKIIGEQHDIFL